MIKYFFSLSVLTVFGCSAESNSPCVLQATYDSGPSSSFNFRKDNTFQWTNGSGFGVSQSEGKYLLNDSIITLDKIGFDRIVKSERLLITTMQPNSHTRGKYLVQVDEQNKIIDSMFIFTIYIDSRNSLK